MPVNDIPIEKRFKGTFVVQVQSRRNESWQGTITWTDQKKSQHFRSTLELIKLIDDALTDQAEGDDPSVWE